MLKKLAIASLCALSAAAFITGCGSSQKPASSAAASAPAEKKEITEYSATGVPPIRKSGTAFPRKVYRLSAKVYRLFFRL